MREVISTHGRKSNGTAWVWEGIRPKSTKSLNPFDSLPQPASATREKEMEKPPPNQSPTAPPPQQAPLHQSDADEEDESVKQLGDCSSVYLSLQDCLVNSNRNWKSCQKEVQALKACNDQRKNHGGK